MYAHNTGSAVQNPEPLYLLAEDNKDVSVTNYLMEEHQVDGLRFLFNQFNKKSPGVIVNFPASCGKSATVAIFLNAVANMLKNPILILCKDDGGIQYWKEILLQWSSYVADDIAMEASNPFIKGKKVFLKKRENLYSYLRRRWSIIIIKENAVNKEMFKHSFEADFKICITATDIKKDLPLLTAVYSWLYPQKVINFNDFVTKENRPKEKFRKSVQLDFLLEDVAIRRYINLKPFQINEKQLFESLGLNSDYQEIPKLVKENNIELNESKDTEDTLIKEESIESLSFGIKSKFYKNNDKCLDTNLIKEESTETLGFSSKSKCDKKDIDILDTNLIKEESKESLSFSSKSKFDKKDMESLDIKEESTESLSFGNKSKFDENHIEDIDTNLIKEESAESLNFGNNSKIELNEMKDLHNRNVLQKQLIESLGLDNVKNEIKDEIKEEATNETSGVVENMHNVVQQIADDLEDNEIVLLKIEQENENVTVSNSNVNIENNKRKSDVIEENLDSKILDLEEKALKKFKGSLLDSLF